MNQIDALKADIEAKRKDLEKLEKSLTNDLRKEAIKDLSEFTDAEKIVWFNELYNSALSIVKEAEDEGYINEDTPNYFYEEAVTIVARDSDKFWKYFSKINN